MKCTECADYDICRMQNDLRKKRKKCPKSKDIRVITNADRIRVMSDEELAYFISDIADTCERNTECNQHCYGCVESYCEYARCLDWLRQPSEEVNEEND